MGTDFFFPEATSTAMPEVAAGLGLARFEDVTVQEHEEWATESNNFGKPDDGVRTHFTFTIMEDKETPKYGEDGDPITLDIKTSMARGKGSRFREVMAGLLTPSEYEEFIASPKGKPWKGAGAVPGRVYNVKIVHNESSGWPQIADVIGQVK